MRAPHGSPVVEGVSRLMAPLIQLFGLYVITHGHEGPGGGFQGGAILAASTILLRLALGEEEAHRAFPRERAIVLGASGLLMFVGVGLVPFALGGGFLDYARLPVPGLSGPALRSLGILVVEVGIGLAVWGALVTLFDHLIQETRHG